MTTGDFPTSFSAYEAQVLAEFPKYKRINKSDSNLMKVISWFLLALSFGKNTSFMNSFTTTIGYTTYVPEGWDTWSEQSRLAILRHEHVHMLQAHSYGVVLYSLLYLFAFFPIGLAYWRTRFEQQAYVETLRAYRDYGFALDDAQKKRLCAYFTGPAYGWMWPFPKSISDWYDASLKKVLSE